VRQGHYAHDEPGLPPPDLAVDHIADLGKLSARDFL
jgi:hypothetical protein